MDLSKNSLYGTISHCFHNMSFGRLVVYDPVYNEYPSMSWSERVVSTFQKLLEWNIEEDNMEAIYNEQIKVVLRQIPVGDVSISNSLRCSF
jgi:hypothetical protein